MLTVINTLAFILMFGGIPDIKSTYHTKSHDTQQASHTQPRFGGLSRVSRRKE